MINLNEAMVERRIGKNPFDFLHANKIPNGTFVSIGYFNDHAISFGPKTRKVINADNDAKLVNYLSGKGLDGNPRFKTQLQSFKDSAKYADALAGNKRESAPLDLSGECHIIKIGKYTVNWRDDEHLAAFYNDQAAARTALRRKYGFGDFEDMYADDDWHRKPNYGGTSQYAKSKRDKSGQVYIEPYEDTGFYRSIVDPEKLAFRQIMNPKIKGNSSVWLFIDSDGTVEYVDKELMNFLRYNYSKVNADKQVEEEIKDMCDEEREFIQELENLEKSELTERTFLLENVVYLTGTVKKPNGEDEAFMWRNDDIIENNYPYMSSSLLEEIINKMARQASLETQQMNESFSFIRGKKSINENRRKAFQKKRLCEDLEDDENDYEDDEEDGWGNLLDECPELEEILSDIYNIEYELKNCAKGAMTGCKTYEDLAEYIREQGDALANQADTILDYAESHGKNN